MTPLGKLVCVSTLTFPTIAQAAPQMETGSNMHVRHGSVVDPSTSTSEAYAVSQDVGRPWGPLGT